MILRQRSAIAAAIAIFWGGVATHSARAQDKAVFVAPPRTIADITATLDQEKPKPESIAKTRNEADAEVATGLPPLQQMTMLEQRSRARANLGRVREAIADLERAIEVGKGKAEPPAFARVRMALVGQLRLSGDHKAALDQAVILAREADKGAKGWLFGTYRQSAQASISLGDLSQAETYVRRSETLLNQSKSWPPFKTFGINWESEVENTKGILFESKGLFKEAEQAYRKAELRKEEFIKRMDADASIAAITANRADQVSIRDTLIANQGRVKGRQGRMAEAESDVRRALLNCLNAVGQFAPGATWFLDQLASVLIDQGRYSEAEGMLRASLQIRRKVGVAEDSAGIAISLYHLARVISFQRRYKESEAVFAELDAAIKNWEPKRRQGFELDSSRVYQHYANGQVEEGIKAAEALLARMKTRFGESHPGIPVARGLQAVGFARAGRQADAIREFKSAISQFTAASREDGQEDNEFAAAARTQGMQFIVEEYIALVARMQPGESEIAETFLVTDAVRAQSVQRALVASSTRLVSQDPKLADLVRKEQDLEMQTRAQMALLNNVLALPVAERDDKAVRALTAQVEKLRGDRATARKNLLRGFPSYAEHVEPKSPSVAEVRSVLRPQEALLSFYLGRNRSFVWVVPKEGPIGFAVINANAADIERLVRRLRDALEPKGETVEDIPKFDVQLAHELYSRLLKPVEDSWRTANSLIVVTNGALGLLPLGLLPTKAVAPTAEQGVTFAGYRDVPWLIRTHAVTSVPSAAALRTLRQLPAGKQASERFIGFGDPLFSVAQAEEAKQGQKTVVAETALRGIPLKRRAAPQTLGVESADLAQLPRLPDTADELNSIASALSVDPQKALFLGRDANEKRIKETDLSRYRIVAFATHGLVPGELNGLTQPALALTAPEVAGIDGDGLLTMEDVLALKLNADWVVLSACNTGTGAGAGAEAASGLGRAFFYAGARTLLLTNWSVHSTSARELVTDLFRRQSVDANLSRAEALRQAMVELMDGPGFSDPSGKTLFSYGHPLFWAPYSILGDGGGR